jgi:perosamine synthetase
MIERGEKLESLIREALPESKKSEGFIPLHEPHFGNNEIDAVAQVVSSGWVSTQGEATSRAEEKLRKTGPYSGAVLTNSGTSALHLALETLGVGQGHSVVIPSLTFAATANAVLYTGAKPVVIDVEDENLSLDPTLLRQFLESCNIGESGPVDPKTGLLVKAVVVVHILGLVADMRPLRELADEFNIGFVEDAAEAFGSRDTFGFQPGEYSDAAIYSFNGNKIITSGGGGALVSAREDFVHEASHLASVAKSGSVSDMSHDKKGFNYKMPALNAALLESQLDRYEEIRNLKKNLSHRYFDVFSKQEEFSLLERPEDWNQWLFHLRVNSTKDAQISGLVDELNSGGLGVRPLWRPMHLLGHLGAHNYGDFNVSESAWKTMLCIPSSPYLGTQA